MLDVHLILDELDDGQQNLGIAMPHEHTIDATSVAQAGIADQLPGVVGQHHHGQIGVDFLD